METREIKSPKRVVEMAATSSSSTTTTTTTALGGNSESLQRKKLGIYFIESDDRRTAFGRGYTGGTTPVNIRGKPISDLSRTGGWIAAFFIFGKLPQFSSLFFLLFPKKKKKRLALCFVANKIGF